jgi:hypothetical protein
VGVRERVRVEPGGDEAGEPKMIVAGGSAYARALDFAGLRAIADEVGALLMVAPRRSARWCSRAPSGSPGGRG